VQGRVFGEVFLSAAKAREAVRNIFCVGRNYRDHALELGNAVPEAPLIFGKPTHAIAVAAGDLVLPEARANIHHELEIVLYMQDRHRPGRAYTESVGGIALGLDLTDRDAQNRLKAAGQPWEFAKGFRNSAVLTDFRRVKDWDLLVETPFTLEKNGTIVQKGVARDMLFSWQALLDYIATHFDLAAGDIVYTGTPAGVGPLDHDDHVTLAFAGEPWGHCRVLRG
jgi:fumarylpyruvate hydrolase